jgi:hypothetical protein
MATGGLLMEEMGEGMGGMEVDGGGEVPLWRQKLALGALLWA